MVFNDSVTLWPPYRYNLYFFIFMTGKVDSLTTKELASRFGSKESADGILSKMDFLNFGVRDLTVHATFGDKLVFK